MSMLYASCRVALAALLHDLGKLAERAKIEGDIESHRGVQPKNKKSGKTSHAHAAYTSLALEQLLPSGPSLKIINDEPFQAETDSLTEVAARHHRPNGPLQKVIAKADCLASSFERIATGTTNEGGYIAVRQFYLLESLHLNGEAHQNTRWRQPLQPFSPSSLFPQQDMPLAKEAEATQEYAALWESFKTAVEQIPEPHRNNLPLWLDHADSAWLHFTHAIPSATNNNAFRKDKKKAHNRPEVSLYDHSKCTAALAVALWRHQHYLDSHPGQKRGQSLLLIQGDFSGIQSFIFAEGSETQKHAAKLLRGRSFQVALLCELAALKVLEALELPSTSQIVNAAGKFLIVAHNTPETRAAIQRVQEELDQWFLEHTCGETSFRLATLTAAQADFSQKRFGALLERLFAQQQAMRLRAFDLCGAEPPAPIHLLEYPDGPCAYGGRRPAQTQARLGTEQTQISHLAQDQILIGHCLAQARYSRILVRSTAFTGPQLEPLELDYFGYRVCFAAPSAPAISDTQLLRCWDIALPEADDRQRPLFQGLARRAVNAYVPLFDPEQEDWQSPRYQHCQEEIKQRLDRSAPLKTLAHIACDDLDDSGKQGQIALAVLRGDVDDLADIFQRGVTPHTFARMASLSRLMNAFFTVHLPWLCAKEFPNTYTVFAGGDDFFLIGPWYATQKLALRLRDDFRRFAAENPELHFSAGLAFAKPFTPIRALGRLGQQALDSAKQQDAKDDEGNKKDKNSKNRFSQQGITQPWSAFEPLDKLETKLAEWNERYQLSSGFIFRLLHLTEKAASNKPEDQIWHSWLAYRVRRFIVDKLRNTSDAEKLDIQKEIAGFLRDVISRNKQTARIPISNYLYRQRTVNRSKV